MKIILIQPLIYHHHHHHFTITEPKLIQKQTYKQTKNTAGHWWRQLIWEQWPYRPIIKKSDTLHSLIPLSNAEIQIKWPPVILYRRHKARSPPNILKNTPIPAREIGAQSREKCGRAAYINVPDDDAFPIGVEEVVSFGVTSKGLGDTPLHLGEAGKDFLWVQRGKKRTIIKK